MAKALSRKLERRVRKGRKAAGRSIGILRADGKPAPGAIVGAAVAGVAGVAGIVAAAHRLRKSVNGKATLHVRTAGEQWIIAVEGTDEPLDAFRTKEEAVEAAREAATRSAPSELVIHRLDGTVMKRHSYAAA